MCLRILLLTMSVVLATACANRGSSMLHEPVGQSTVPSTRQPPADAAPPAAAEAVPNEGAANDVESYVTGKSAGPCGIEPPVVPFTASSTDVAEPQIQELRRLAECLTTAPFDTASVVLVGYTDVMGTGSDNLARGLKRAQVVMEQLMASGVRPGRIVVASAGELQRPHARWGMHAHRVEILIARGGPARPDEPPIARGVDAEGLAPRRPQSAAPAANASPPVRAPAPVPAPARRTLPPARGR